MTKRRAVLRTAAATLLAFAAIHRAAGDRVEAETLPLAKKEAALTRWVFGHNGDVSDAPLACAPAAGPCVVGATHRNFAAPVAVPPLATCAPGGGGPLLGCYAGAIERLQQALDSGQAWVLFEAAQRARDVATRADAAPGVPAWMKSASPNNLLIRFYADQGMQLTALGSCVTGTEKARYACMGGPAGPSDAVFRAAIDILDHHSDVLVNWGETVGARARLEKIVRSASAPGFSAMVAVGLLDPLRGPGLPRADLLGKIAYLRTLTGEAGSFATEKAYFDGLTAYQADPGSPRLSANLWLFSAMRAATWTNWQTRSTFVVDPLTDADLVSLLDAINMGVHLELVRGDRAAATAAGQLAAHMASTRRAMAFDSLGLLERWTHDLGDFLLDFGWSDGLAHCDWFTVEDIVRSVTAMYPVTETERVWIDDCLPHQDGCEPGSGHWETFTTTTWVQGPTTTITIGETVIAESIRANYKQLLDADDGDYVDADHDFVPDIDYEDATLLTNATIARAGILADECLNELETVSGGYQHSLDAGDLQCTSDSDCHDDYGGSDGRLFLPYEMAARLCPTYAANAVGINAVALANGEVIGEALDCPTPLEFVATVADTLENADSKFIDAIDAKLGDINALLADFLLEGFLLTTPVAGMLRQRADLAYFSHEPLGDCADTPTGDCVGLAVQKSRLDAAADAILKGIALYRQFSRIDRGEQSLDGDDALATWAADGVAVCEACTGLCLECLGDSKPQIRALGYRRLRDAIGLYQSVRSDEIELLRRQLDGMPGACRLDSDADGDGVVDCDAANPACGEFCPLYDEASDLVAQTASDMTSAVTDLDEQLAITESIGTSSELESLISDTSALAAATSDGVAADHAVMLNGVDWLGNRQGEWAVVSFASGSSLSEQIESDLAVFEQDAIDFGGEYGGWVASYLDELADQEAFALAATDASLEAQGAVGAYCQDLGTGAAAPGGCGLGTELDSQNPTAQHINGVLETRFCNVANAQFAEVAVSLTDPTSPNYLPAGDPYLDWVAEKGLDACPELLTVDVDALTAEFGGSLIERNVLGMDTALRELEAAVTDFHGFVQLMDRVDDLFNEYEDAVGAYQRQQATKEFVLDALVCGAAVVGATAATIGSYGAGAGTWVGAAQVCHDRYKDDAGDLIFGDITPEDLAFENAFLNQDVARAEQLYTFTNKLENVLLRVADYEAQVFVYRSQLAAFQRAIAFSNTSLDALGAYRAENDPVFLANENDELRLLKANFKEFAGRIEEAQATIVYDMANLVPEAAAFQREVNDVYWMPRLAEIAVAAPASIDPDDVDTAYTFLEMVGGTVEPAVQDQSLLAAASLLLRVYDDFRDVYGERLPAETAFIGSGLAGLSDADGDGIQDRSGSELVYDNPGEYAMLGDSRFYDPGGATGDGPSAACAPGWVDVSHYCSTFTDGTPTAAGDCADIRAMTVQDRLELAHLDHMVRSVGVEAFDCTVDGGGTIGVAARVGSGSGGRFTGGALGDLPWPDHDVTDWYRGHEVVDTAFYLAQTKAVRTMIDLYLDGVEDETAALSSNFNFYPGDYVYQIDMANPWLEPEVDVLDGAVDAPQTMSEQLDAMVVVCTSFVSCGATSTSVEDDKPIDMVVFGPYGHKGTRCRQNAADAVASGNVYPDGASRQTQIAFRTDHDLAAGTIQTFKQVLPEADPMIEDALDASTLLQRPLHATRLLFSVHALYQQSGIADNTDAWAFHLGGTEPRLRVAARYSYYNTDPILGAPSIAIDDFLTCPLGSEPM